MATVTFSFSKTNGQSFEESDIQTFINEVETFLNTTGVDAGNIIDGSLTPANINEDQFFADDSLTLTNTVITVGEVPTTAIADAGIDARSIGVGSLSRTDLAGYVEITAGSTATSQEYFYEINNFNAETAEIFLTSDGHSNIVAVDKGNNTTGFTTKSFVLKKDNANYLGWTLSQNDAGTPMLFVDTAAIPGDADGSQSTISYAAVSNPTQMVVLDGGI